MGVRGQARYLIVTADDFGLTPGITRAILRAHEQGIVTSASLMSVGPACDEALARARDFPRLGLGVHLTWVDERPLCPPSEIPTLVDERGRLFSLPQFLARLRRRRIRLSDIVRETRAQLERVFAAGIRPTHVDSHKHLHLYPPLLDMLLRLLPEYGIRALRLPLEPLPSPFSRLFWRALPRALPVWILARWGRPKLAAAGMRHAEAFFGLFHTGRLTESVLMKIVSHLPEGVSELLCHPGFLDTEIQAVRTRLRSSREEEFRALTSPAVKEAIHQRGIRLVNYEELFSPFTLR